MTRKGLENVSHVGHSEDKRGRGRQRVTHIRCLCKLLAKHGLGEVTEKNIALIFK